MIFGSLYLEVNFDTTFFFQFQTNKQKKALSGQHNGYYYFPK